MGQRYCQLGKKKKHKKNLAPSPSLPSQATQAKTPVTTEQKNDTIKAINFFGFSPELYWLDLRRTAGATLVIAIILLAIYYFTSY
jgi:hypothetical protein